MNGIEAILQDERIAVRRAGLPANEGRCVVYWMQRAQRATGNPALNTAVKIANELEKPLVVFFAPVPFYPRANLRHYRFLGEGIPDIAEDLARRNIGFVLRSYPEHHLLKFCEEVRPAIVIGDENPLREPEHWRVTVAQANPGAAMDGGCGCDCALKIIAERTVRGTHHQATDSCPACRNSW